MISGADCKFKSGTGLWLRPLASNWKNLFEHIVSMISKYTTGYLERSFDRHVEAENSTSLAACDKDVF